MNALLRAGDANNNLIPIYDPLTTRLNPAFDPSRPVSAANPQFLRDLFPGNVIPADRLSPAGLLYLQLYARPNVTPSPGTCANWVESVDTPIDWEQRNVRLDYDVTSATRAMFRYTHDKWLNGDPNAQRMWGDDPFPAVDSSWDQPGTSVVGQLSQRRADSVIRYLVENHNIPLRRIITPYGYGELQPVAENTTREGREQNRRVEVKVLVNRGILQGAPAMTKPSSDNPE